MQRKSKGVARNCGGEQGQSIAKQRMSIAPMSRARAELRIAKICVAKRGHSKERLGMAKHRSAKA